MPDDTRDKGSFIATSKPLDNGTFSRRKILLAGTTLAAASALGTGNPIQVAQAQQQPAAPSGRRPNIHRISREGMMFTDYYAENSCTAGRSSFITGQAVYRTGMSKVGLPGAPVGLQAQDITIAEALKPLGYATGQFGKNHLGARGAALQGHGPR